MYRTRTGAQLITSAMAYADVEGKAARFPPSLQDLWLNESLEAYRELVTRSGMNPLLAAGTVATVAGTPTVSFGAIPEVHLVSVLDGDVYTPLATYEGPERHDWSGETGIPRSYRIDANSSNALTCRLQPTPDAVYTIEFQYLPSHTEFANGATTAYALDFLGAEWVALDLAEKFATREKDVKAINLLSARKREKQDRLVFRAAKRDRSRPSRVIDVRRRPMRWPYA